MYTLKMKGKKLILIEAQGLVLMCVKLNKSVTQKLYVKTNSYFLASIQHTFTTKIIVDARQKT